MKLPKTFRFMSQEWTIIEGHTGKAGDSKKYMGRANFKRRNIYIREDMSDDIKKNTLVHEIMHIIIRTQGITGDDEEATVEGITNGIMEAYRQNPWLKDILEEK